MKYNLYSASAFHRPDLNDRTANLRGPHRRPTAKLGRNRIELQENALKALESLGRAQNCTPRFGFPAGD
jgi:hypothetical protein